MKFTAIALLFAVALTCCLAAKRCQEKGECDPGQCCVAATIFGFGKGDCKDLAKLNEGCNDESMKYRGKYLADCPCAPGLFCEPTEVEEVPFGITFKLGERCVEGTTTIKSEPESSSEMPKE